VGKRNALLLLCEIDSAQHQSLVTYESTTCPSEVRGKRDLNELLVYNIIYLEILARPNPRRWPSSSPTASGSSLQCTSRNYPIVAAIQECSRCRCRFCICLPQPNIVNITAVHHQRERTSSTSQRCTFSAGDSPPLCSEQKDKRACHQKDGEPEELWRLALGGGSGAVPFEKTAAHYSGHKLGQEERHISQSKVAPRLFWRSDGVGPRVECRTPQRLANGECRDEERGSHERRRCHNPQHRARRHECPKVDDLQWRRAAELR
jgi:hypothetical protein